VDAVTDNYHRKSSKKARFRPKVSDKKKKKIKPPKIRQLEPDEIKKLKQFAAEVAA